MAVELAAVMTEVEPAPHWLNVTAGWTCAAGVTALLGLLVWMCVMWWRQERDDRRTEAANAAVQRAETELLQLRQQIVALDDLDDREWLRGQLELATEDRQPAPFPITEWAWR